MSRPRIPALAAVLLALAPALAWAQTAADDYARGRELRLAGRPAEAATLLARAAESEPGDADIWLNLGLAYTANRQFDRADQAFERALAVAPAYTDVQLARTRLAFFRHDLDEADRRLAPVLQREPANAEARQLQQQIAAARSETYAPWRLDAAVSRARLGEGLPQSTSAVLALSRQTARGLTVGGGLEQIRQFGRSDTYVEGVVSGALGYLALGGTPDADFRPELALRAGLAGRRWSLSDGWTLQLAADASWSRYPVGDVRAVHPVLTLARGEGLRLQARWINVLDERDDYRRGYALGADWRALPRLRLSLGWADAPESTEGVTTEVQAASLGAAVELDPRLTVRAAVARESRPAYDRDELTLALTRRF